MDTELGLIAVEIKIRCYEEPLRITVEDFVERQPHASNLRFLSHPEAASAAEQVQEGSGIGPRQHRLRSQQRKEDEIEARLKV